MALRRAAFVPLLTIADCTTAAAVAGDSDARPGGEIAALEAIGERRGGAYRRHPREGEQGKR